MSRNLYNENFETDSDQMRKQVHRWRFVISHFMRRVMNNYILTLQDRSSCQRYKTKDACYIKEVEIVLIKSDVPRLSWKRRKIEKLIDSDDVVVGAADVRVYHLS